jgi:hypothetical protein
MSIFRMDSNSTSFQGQVEAMLAARSVVGLAGAEKYQQLTNLTLSWYQSCLD